ELEELRKFFLSLDRRILFASTGQGEIDLYSPDGVLHAQIKTAFSEHEVRLMAVRQKRSARYRAQMGKPKWRNAFGYLPFTGPKELDDGVRAVDPETAPLVKEAYAATLAGASLNEVCRMFNDAGAYGLNGRPWTATTLSMFLRAPRNAGLSSYNGEVVKDADGHSVRGTWPPLVDEETWRAVQSVMNAPGRKPGPKSVRRHLLTGMMRCGNPRTKQTGEPCDGGLLTGYRDLKNDIWYRCPVCFGVSVQARHVESLVRATLAKRLARSDAVDLLRAELHDAAEEEQIRTQRQTLVARLGEIADERADGLIDGAGYRRMTERIQSQLDELEARQLDQDRLRVLDGVPLGQPEAVAAVEALSPDRLRAVLALLVEVTVMPVGRGYRVQGKQQFEPERVKVRWLSEDELG
ncbi:recombinase family protein, partial [Mycolicibacterium thermoresistibile]